MPSVNELIPHVQVAVGPVIFISGVGLLLLTMTNRFARVVDRARVLADQLRSAAPTERPRLAEQVEIMARRARVVRRAITYAAVSVFFVSLLMIALFLAALLELNWAILVMGLFSGALGCLVISLAYFIYDFRYSLRALDLDLDRREPGATA